MPTARVDPGDADALYNTLKELEAALQADGDLTEEQLEIYLQLVGRALSYMSAG